jgi:hypothetical protein
MWVRDREYEIYTLVKARVNRRLGEKYKDMYFTQDDEQIVETQLPTVYIHALPGAEMAKTLDGKGINAMLFTFEITVTVSKKQGQTTASEVIWEVIAQFKKMRFDVIMSPTATRSNNAAVQQFVARVRRPIGANDNIQS